MRANQPRQPYRAAAADEDAALAFRQREIGRGFGDANMGCAGKLQPAADHRALEGRNHGHVAILNAVEHSVPHLRVQQSAGGVTLGQLGEIKPGGEMIADAMDDDRADTLRQRRKAVADGLNDAVIERIALGRAVQPYGQDLVGPLDLEQRIRFRNCGIGVSHG